MHTEHERLRFYEQRDGIEGAISAAKQIMGLYRKAVLTSRKRGFSKPHHASLPEYRRKFIESYCVCKEYLMNNRP